MDSTAALAAAEDRAEDAAHDLAPDLRADGARGALGHRLDQALRLLAAARPGLAEQDVVDRVGRFFVRGRRGWSVLFGAPLQFLVGGFAVDRLFISNKQRGRFVNAASFLF